MGVRRNAATAAACVALLGACGRSSSGQQGSLIAPQSLQFCSALAGAGNALEAARGTVDVDVRAPLYRSYIDQSLNLVAAAPAELEPHVESYTRWFKAFRSALEAHDYGIDAALSDAGFSAVDADPNVVAALKSFGEFRTANCTDTVPVTAASAAPAAA
jgi:hypothetical protein